MDLFDDDKRLALAPVVAFNTLLEQALAEGACPCVRCQDSTNSPFSGQVHTFKVDGKQLARKFVPTVPSDVEGVLGKAYKAFYKKDLTDIRSDLLGEFQAMASQPNTGRVKLLLEVTGLLGAAALPASVEAEQAQDFAGEFEGDFGLV